MATCKTCIHKEACAAWIHHGEILYNDFEYSVDNCPYYASTENIVPVDEIKFHHMLIDKDGIPEVKLQFGERTLILRRVDDPLDIMLLPSRSPGQAAISLRWQAPSAYKKFQSYAITKQTELTDTLLSFYILHNRATVWSAAFPRPATVRL